MMGWRPDSELMQESLAKAYRLREECDERFDRLLEALARQDEALRKPTYQN